jgi:hypothetical protein
MDPDPGAPKINNADYIRTGLLLFAYLTKGAYFPPNLPLGAAQAGSLHKNK